MSVVTKRSHIYCLRVYPLSIRFRRAFRHAAKIRESADPLVVEVELGDGTMGFGETLPREYVSGETVESVVRSIRQEFMADLMSYRPASFAEALERIEALPAVDDEGKVMAAARAGVELALLDAYSRHFEKPIAEAVGWFGLAGFGAPGSIRRVRYSGVLSGGELEKLAWSVCKMRWFGLRDFKLKVGYEDDVERIRVAARALGRSLGRKTTLRLDANGAWSLERAISVLAAVGDLPIHSVEQPLAQGKDDDLVALKRGVAVRVVHDESVVTLADAQRLLNMGVADGLNIRISKNGGFLPALRLAHFARRNNVMYQLGCMVGETSVLSAVGRRFIENVPGLTFAEGSYGRFLMTADVVRRRVQFGYGGKPKPLAGLGWGVEVEPEMLRCHVQPGVIEFPL